MEKNCYMRFEWKIKQLLPVTVLALCSQSIVGQDINTGRVRINLPVHAGKTLSMALKHDIQADTVYNAFLDKKGYAEIILPKAYKDYRGMVAVNADNRAVFEFIMAGENFSLSCEEEFPHGGNVTFTGSPENESLQTWFFARQKRQTKIAMLDELLHFYDKTDAFRSSIEQEKSGLEQQEQDFEAMLKASPLYAAAFMRFYDFQNREVAGLLYADSLKMQQVRAYVRDSLDINGLFTSGLWFGTLNGLLALYDNNTPYHKDFIEDMSLLLERAATDRIYNTLAENLVAICESTGWDDLEEQLAYRLINAGRIKNPEGKLKMLMTVFKLAKGSKAPALTQGTFPPGNVLLVFYQSGCGPCEEEIQQLTANYPLLKEKGYEVVTVSCDTDEDVFRNTASTFPWQAKYCDLKAYDGDDFRNYGVIGTPTIYLIDKDGVLQGRYAKLADTGIF